LKPGARANAAAVVDKGLRGRKYRRRKILRHEKADIEKSGLC
jgi:hypothetical protein